VQKDHGKDAWFICDGHADTEHSLPKPHIPEPCESYEECLELCDILNEDEHGHDSYWRTDGLHHRSAGITG